MPDLYNNFTTVTNRNPHNPNPNRWTQYPPHTNQSLQYMTVNRQTKSLQITDPLKSLKKSIHISKITSQI